MHAQVASGRQLKLTATTKQLSISSFLSSSSQSSKKNISSLQIQKMPRTRSTRASMRRPARGRGTPLTSVRATRGANRTAVERCSATVSPHAESLTSTDQPLSTLTLDQFLSVVREEVRAELQESQTQVIAHDSNMPTVLLQHQPAQGARELTTFCMCMCGWSGSSQYNRACRPSYRPGSLIIS